MDEPSIGLHQRDHEKLIQALKDLRDLGNSVLVVEHDKDMMLESDYILDIGPGAGRHGGNVVGSGTPAEY
jgi:excinuclease ABC subunit A